MTEPAYPTDLYTVDQVRSLDQQLVAALGIESFELMQRAAAAGLGSLRRHWPRARKIMVFCGPGNNGADGYLLAALARAQGIEATVMALPTASPRGDTARTRQVYEAAGGQVAVWNAPAAWPTVEVQVDALFGTGLNRAPAADATALIERMHASETPTLALDVPSGLNANTGHCPGAAVRATVTVSFVAAKRGLRTGQAAAHVGQLELASLGLPDSLRQANPPDARLLEPRALSPRARDAHKGTCGHVLAIGGDHGTAGAIRLCGEAALRAGAGKVSVATQPEQLVALNSARPELMAHAVNGPQALKPLLQQASVLAVGPGLGQRAWGHALWLTALDADMPLVLDADGLNLLAKEPRCFSQPAVLTPHPGEAARLLGSTVAAVEADRFAAVRALARKFNAVTVLKGAGSLIAAPDGRLDVCSWGNPGMASGGMGDLLTGIIAALMAQGCTAWNAACLGVGLHARAGDFASRDGERGLLASDLLAPLRRLLNGLDA